MSAADTMSAADGRRSLGESSPESFASCSNKTSELALDRRKTRWNLADGTNLKQSLKTILIVLLLFIIPNSDARDCNACRLLTETFKKGLATTTKSNFGGGNTRWEEEKLGKYSTSETRLVEVYEHTCKNKDGIEKHAYLFGFDLVTDKDADHACHAFLEEHEDTLEYWYYHQQSKQPDLYKWLCITSLQICCPHGTYGKQCNKCPGIDENDKSCFGHGTCDGEGTRKGHGRCKCDAGYAGKICRRCGTAYYASEQNDTHINCEACHAACKGGCKAAGADNCNACHTGWDLVDNACVDVDECKRDPGPCAEDKFSVCVNTDGSHRCDCMPKFKKEGGLCVPDVEKFEPPEDGKPSIMEIGGKKEENDEAEHATDTKQTEDDDYDSEPDTQHYDTDYDGNEHVEL